MISGDWVPGMRVRYVHAGHYEYTIKKIMAQDKRECRARYYCHQMKQECSQALFHKSHYDLIKPAKITDVSQMVF